MQLRFGLPRARRVYSYVVYSLYVVYSALIFT